MLFVRRVRKLRSPPFFIKPYSLVWIGFFVVNFYKKLIKDIANRVVKPDSADDIDSIMRESVAAFFYKTLFICLDRVFCCYSILIVVHGHAFLHMYLIYLMVYDINLKAYGIYLMMYNIYLMVYNIYLKAQRIYLMVYDINLKVQGIY